MDNPGISLFQGADIQINNSHNSEEEEDLQDKLRIQAELQNLLTEKLDEFKYDDSETTVNSSTNVSLISVDNLQQKYKEAIDPNDQLKILYEVRVREISALKQEYESYKAEKSKEINLLKNRLLLLEGEVRQYKVSQKNSDDLLVEKTDTIRNFESKIQKQDEKISNLEKTVKDYEFEVNTYKSEIVELQLKLQNQPFNLNSKHNSEELQKSLQEKICHLGNLLEEQTHKAKTYEKENILMKEELKGLVKDKEELQKDYLSVLRNFDEAQQQCHHLIDVIEMAKKENEHLKEMLKTHECTVHLEKSQTLDNASLMSHNEKLKKMLLAKSIELDTLKTKLKNYENDLKELLIYRQLKNDVYRKEFKKCDNSDHTKDLLLMQNELQNYRRTIDDKNQQILNLNSINKDLQEKIEEMILQTRNEIQNISHKYSLPQLKAMSEDLKSAEDTINELNLKLEKSEERRQSLLHKMSKTGETNDELNIIEKYEGELREVHKLLENEQETNTKLLNDLGESRSETEKLKNVISYLKLEVKKLKSERKDLKISYSEDAELRSEYEFLKNQLAQVMKHLERNKFEGSNSDLVKNIKDQMDNFLKELEGENIEKGILEEKVNSWKKILDEISEDKHLKNQYKEAITNLRVTQDKLKEFEDLVEDLRNAATILEGEKCTLTFELNKCTKQLEDTQKHCLNLENNVQQLKISLQNFGDLELLKNELESNKQKVRSKERELKTSEQKIKELNQEMEKLKEVYSDIKDENAKLVRELQEAKDEVLKYNVKQKLEGDTPVNMESDNFKKCLDEELMKCELKLRDELQIEYQKRIHDIEKRYQNCLKESNELHTRKFQEQDQRYREHLKLVMTECAKCTKESEDEKLEVINQIKLLRQNFEQFKKNATANEERYSQMLKSLDFESKKNINAWKNWSKHMVGSCLGIDEINKKSRDKILKDMKSYDAEVASIEKKYNDKIKRKIDKV